jgi:predicted DNA-binding transcriptional regulator AlpA
VQRGVADNEVLLMKYLRFRDLVESGRVNNRMTLHRRIDAGLCPPPVDLGPNTVAWTDQDLAEYDERVKAGTTEPNPAWLERAAKRKAARLAKLSRPTKAG